VWHEQMQLQAMFFAAQHSGTSVAFL